MDPITHILFGATLSRTGLDRKTGLATLTLVLASEFPDFDIAILPFSRVENFAHHRGFTHTFLGAPVMAGCVLAIVYGIYRWRQKRGKEPVIAPRWKLLYAYALAASLLHIFLDFTNGYGVRPFAPFDPRWYEWDIVFIIEPVMLTVLIFGLVGPWFLNLIGGEIGARRSRFPARWPAVVAMLMIIGMWWVRDYNHRRAVAYLQAGWYDGKEPLRVAAYPYWLNPFQWHGVVETRASFITLPVDTLVHQGAIDSAPRIIRSKPEETRYTLAAKQSRLGQVYLDWAKFPYVESEVYPDGSATVVFRDLRFLYPQRRPPPLSMSVELNNQLRVTEEHTFVPSEVEGDSSR